MSSINDLYFSINGYNLNDAFVVTSIERTLLPAKEYNTINIPTIDGERLNGVKYSPLVYTIQILIEGNDIEDRNLKKRTLRDLLKPKEQFKVAFNKFNHGYGMVTSEVSIEDRNSTQSIAEFELTCFNPFFYANNVQLYENTGQSVTVVNGGGEKVKPFITVGFSQDAHFCQVENRNTGEKILVGNYPSLVSTETYKEQEVILYHNCESTTGWTSSSASIDTDRATGGTIGIASDGNGLVLSSLPSSSTATWKGACYRINLDEACEEFTVQANIAFNASGVNGDPSVKNYDLDEETIVTGSKTTKYRVTATALNVRTGPSTSYSILGTVAMGYEITNGTMVNNWLQFTDSKWPGKTCYCSGKYLTAVVVDNTTTTTLQNWVVTNSLGAALCSAPKWGTNNSYGTQLCRIPVGTVLRLNVSTEYREDYTQTDGTAAYRIFYKLHIPYNGMTGYICRMDCTRADLAVEYNEDEIIDTADDKTGLLEVYGFDSSGSKLFSIVVADWNKYYECVMPRCEVGQTTIMGSNGETIPAPKTSSTASTEDGTTTVNTKYILSGQYGDWNDMEWCKFNVTRRTVNGKQIWASNLARIDGGVVTKTMAVSNQINSDFPTGNLSYIVLYIGTTDSLDKACDMALTDLYVTKYNQPTSTEAKASYFQQGDILDIDFENRAVYINEMPANYLLDIGSRFFDINTGITDVKVISDDADAVSAVVINEKWVGDA